MNNYMKKAERQKIDAFELWYWIRLLRVPWTAKRSNQSILKESKPWIFIGKTDAEVEAPILWPPDAKSWFIGKDPDAGKDWGQEEKEATEDEKGWMASSTQRTWIWANSRDSEGQGNLVCRSPWDHKESDTTERLNNNKVKKGTIPSFQ